MFWKVFYWSSMLLSYVGIPWLMGYEMSGEFNETVRVKQSFIDVLMFYVYILLAGGCFIVLLLITGKVSLSSSNNGFTIIGFLMALGGAAGLLQIIVFLGYGLISVPKFVKFQANNKSRFDVALCQVDLCDD